VPAGYPVYTFGSTTLSSGASVGSTSITVANATSYSAGQGILISGAGTSGTNNGDYVGVIQSVSSNTITISPATGTTVSSGANVQHDDTNAIQTAISVASINQNVSLIFPDGLYQVNGPLQNTGTANCILQVPTELYFSGGTGGTGIWYPTVVVGMKGVTSPPFSENYLTNNTIPHLTGAIIYTNRTSGSLIGGYNASSWNDFTNVKLQVESLTLRSDLNTGIKMVNALNIAYFYGQHLTVDVTSTNSGTTTTTLTNSSGGGIYLPGGGNGGNNVLIDAEMYGYYTALTVTEHNTLIGLRFDANLIALTTKSGSAYFYGTSGENLQINGCYHGLNATSGHTTIDLRHVNFEHHGASSEDVLDSSNYLFGTLTSDTQTVAVTGASGLKVITPSMAVAQLTGEFGSCTMSAGTCGAKTLVQTYSSAPNCTATWTGSGTLTGFLSAPSTTTTVTPASSVNTDTAVVNWHCLSSAMTK
jgi:hypothetical protein